LFLKIHCFPKIVNPCVRGLAHKNVKFAIFDNFEKNGNYQPMAMLIM